jgi:hypothetical protein
MLQPFKITDKKTGKTLTVYGPTAPTEQDQEELFDAYEKGTWKPSPPPKPFTITDEKNKLSLTVYGDEAPTEQEQKELFSAYRKGTWRPAARPVYRTEEELTAAVKNREEQGEAPEDVKTFVEQALKDRESERTRELKSMFAAQTSSPFGAMGLANMDPALRREMLEAQAKPTPAAISETPASGQIGDIGMKVVVPLAVGIATRNPLAMAAAGAGVDMLVQQREEMRGEPVKSAPVRGTRVLTESVLTAINPPALKAGTGVAQGALIRGTQTGAMVGAGELAQQVVGQATGQDVVDIGEVFDVATLGAAFGGAFGALETTAPAVWAKIKDLKPLRALRVLLGEPKTPEIEKAIEGLQQVVHQNFPGDQILVQKRADLRREALQQRAREAGEEVGPVPSEEVAKAFEPFEGVVPPSPAEESARAFQEDVGLAKLDAERIMAEGMAPRPVNPAAAIEEAVGISQTAEQPKGYSPAAPGTEGPVAPSQQTELAREARRADATQAFENLPVATRAEESARILEEAAMQQDRAIANLAGRMEENFFQGRLGSEETSPTPDMDRVRKADQRLAELERRPGGAAKETARVEAQKAEAMKDVAAATAAQRAVREETEKAAGAVPTPPPTPEPELSPQAQRMVDRFGGADRQLLMGLAGGGTGFVVGWNTGEGLPPDQRLARALASGVGGAFTPTAIRRIIGMQGWANRVIKERGVGSGALNTADPQILAALSVKGAALVGEGVKNFAEWGDKMVREFGDSIRPKLKEIWAAGQEADIIPNKLVDKAPERPPRQYETPEFKKWFQQSKAVQQDGRPVDYYHGAFSKLQRKDGKLIRTKDFTVFESRPRHGTADKHEGTGFIMVTPNPEFAGYFAGWQKNFETPMDAEWASKNRPGGRIYKLWVRANNPFDYANPDHVRKIFGDAESIRVGKYDFLVDRQNVLNGDWNEIEALAGTIRKAGFDGFYVAEDRVKNLAVFDPNQLKSATGNRGTFSLRDRDIRRSLIPSDPASLMAAGQAVAGATGGAAMGDTPEERRQYALAGAVAGMAGRPSMSLRAKGLISPDEIAKSAQAAPKMDPRIARFITKQLAIPMGSFAGGFTYGFIEGAELPPDQRLINGLQWAAVIGGIGYAVAKRSLNSISGERVSEAAAKKLAPDAPTGQQVLEEVDKIFTPRPTELSEGQKLLNTPQAKLVRNFQDGLNPLSVASKEIVGKGENMPLGDAASIVSGAVGKAEAALYPVQQAQKELVSGLEPKEFNRYFFLRRVIDRLTVDPKSRAVGTWTIEKSRLGLEEMRRTLGDETFINLEKFARVVQTSADEDLRLMVRSGRMSERDYAAIKADNEFYAPFYVAEYFGQMDGTVGGMGRAIDTTQPLTKAVKGMKDDDIELIDIMSAFSINKMRAHVLADKNTYMRRVAAAAKLDTEHRFMKDLGTSVEAKYSGEVPKGWEVVNYMEDGLQKKIAVLPELAKALKGLDTARADIVIRGLGRASAPFRLGVITFNAGFQLVNIGRDASRLGLISKYGVTKNPVEFGQFVGDLFVGLTSSWKSNILGDKNELYLEYLKSGAARSTLASNLTPNALNRAIEARDEKLVAKILKVPYRTVMSGGEKFGNMLEETIKLAGFRRGVRMEGLDKLSGKEYEDALERIVYEVRNYAGSPDFNKHGSYGPLINAISVFYNARVQGVSADLRRLTGGTGKAERNAALVRLLAGGGTAAAYVWYLNQLPENKEDYEKRSVQERNAYFLFPRKTETGDPLYYVNEEGQKVREYYRVPKFEFFGIASNMVESALNYALKKDPKSGQDAARAALEGMFPINISGRSWEERVQSAASGLNPVIKTPIEIFTNTNLFQHRPIVKQRLQGVRPEEQYLETTPKAFITAAQAMPEVAPNFLRSPLYLKQLTENLTGGLVTQFMRPELEGRGSATTNPLIARFFAAPILDEQETWDQINYLKTEQSTKNLLRQRAIDQYIKDSASYTPAQRMQSLAQLLASDPERNAAAMYNALLDRNRGVTDVDRAVRSLEPQFRAQFLEEKVRKMETKEQRDAFYREMILKGIINDKTLEEILKLRTAPEGKKTSMKEGKLYRDPTTGVMKIYRNGAFV